jgi:D-alanyl-D-alanine carboxypeptidase
MHDQAFHLLFIAHSIRRRKKVILGLLIFLTFTFYFFLSDSVFKTVTYQAAIVIDAPTEEILYARNPNRQLPPASTTKLMTAITVIESKNLSDIATISKNASLAPSPLYRDPMQRRNPLKHPLQPKAYRSFSLLS